MTEGNNSTEKEATKSAPILSAEGLRNLIDKTHERIESNESKKDQSVRESILRTANQITQEELVKQTHRAEIAEDNSMLDENTGLRNYRWLTNRIDKAIERQEKTGKPFWLLFMDFDDFKKYNNRFDHPGGDKVLRLMRAPNTRQYEEVARYGGDEFVQILNDDIEIQQAAEVASRNAHSIEEAGQRLLPTLEVSDHNSDIIERVTVSLGLIESRKGVNAEDLLKFGSIAVREGKKAGKDAIVVAPKTGEIYRIDRSGKKIK